MDFDNPKVYGDTSFTDGLVDYVNNSISGSYLFLATFDNFSACSPH